MGGLLFILSLRGGASAMCAILFFVLPSLALGVLINMLMRGGGATAIPGGAPSALSEAFLGAAGGAAFCSAFIWLFCYGAVMTSDKIFYIFGGFLPGLSLIFVMAPRVVKTYAAQLRYISEAQTGIGRAAGSGSLMNRFRRSIKIVSIMLTWALENTAELFDSVRARGCGLPGRTSYRLFRFGLRDAAALIILITFAASAYASSSAFASSSVSAYAAGLIYLVLYGLLCLSPFFFGIAETLSWKRLDSRAGD